MRLDGSRSGIQVGSAKDEMREIVRSSEYGGQINVFDYLKKAWFKKNTQLLYYIKGSIVDQLDSETD